LSPERVWSEFKRILVVPDPVGSVRLMAELGVLQAILPGADAAGLEPIMGAPADPILRLAALRPPPGVARRWRMSTAEAEALAALAAPAPPLDLAGADLQRTLADTPASVLIGRSWLVDGAAGEPVRARLAAAERPIFALAGRDALALGVPPGPAVGELIRSLREWWLAGGCVASAAECRAELARRVASECRQG
jgi:poly(A) polymerase/tRNA nucleotidyltransferase (CCA-adding enzyme)